MLAVDGRADRLVYEIYDHCLQNSKSLSPLKFCVIFHLPFTCFILSAEGSHDYYEKESNELERNLNQSHFQ